MAKTHSILFLAAVTGAFSSILAHAGNELQDLTFCARVESAAGEPGQGAVSWLIFLEAHHFAHTLRELKDFGPYYSDEAVLELPKFVGTPSSDSGFHEVVPSQLNAQGEACVTYSRREIEMNLGESLNPVMKLEAGVHPLTYYSELSGNESAQLKFQRHSVTIDQGHERVEIGFTLLPSGISGGQLETQLGNVRQAITSVELQP